MRLYLRTGRRSGIALGGFALLALSPVLLYGAALWLVWQVTRLSVIAVAAGVQLGAQLWRNHHHYQGRHTR